MDSATILVLLIIAGGSALLVWFEINSRRTDHRKKQVGSAAQSDATGVVVSKGRAEVEKTKAA